MDTGGFGLVAGDVVRIFSTAAYCSGVAFIKRNNSSVEITVLMLQVSPDNTGSRVTPRTGSRSRPATSAFVSKGLSPSPIGWERVATGPVRV